jgi:hypothetical protein
MRKYFLIISILYWHTSNCQVDNIYARIEITSISLEEHRTWIDTSIILTLEKFGHSEIINLGKIDSLEVGFQLEVSKSRLGDTDLLVIGKAFYFKKDGKWQMHSRPMYQSPEFKIASVKPPKMPDDYGMGATTIQGLQVEYKEHYFIIR